MNCCKIKMLLHLLLLPTIAGSVLTNHSQLLQELLTQEPSCENMNCGQNVLCNCDNMCNFYGDCCLQKIIELLYSNSTNSENLFPPYEKRFHCENFPNVQEGSQYYMVTSCLEEWQDLQVSLRCAKSDKLPHYTYILDIPVWSRDTKTFYSNIYCATCNNDSSSIGQNVHYLECHPETPTCQSLPLTAKYKPGELRWEEGNVSITIGSVIPREARHCTKYIDECDEHYLSSLGSVAETGWYRDACAVYHNPVFIVWNRSEPKAMYKNMHCAACNGIRGNYTGVQCVHRDGSAFDNRPPSFALILDFGTSGSVGSSSACSKGQIQDPVTGLCLDYACGQLYEMDGNGQCVPKLQLPDNIHNGSLNESCIKIAISPSEYIQINESTIKVNMTNNVFETRLFELSDNGTVLICAPDSFVQRIGKFSTAQGLLSTICLTLSLSCLLIHILVHVLVTSLRNLPGKNLLSLSCSIFVAQLLFLVAVDIKGPRFLCIAVGAVIHLSYLASFFWMNVMAFDTCRTFTSKSVHLVGHQRRTFHHYSTYAWMFPCLIVTMSLTFNFTNTIPELNPRYAEPLCWFNSRTSLATFLALPLLVLLVENIIFFILTAWAIRKATADAAFAVHGSKATERTRFFVYVKLALIVGLTWVFGFLAGIIDAEPVWYIFIIMNSLQGVFIFCAFTFKRRIFSLLMDKLPLKQRTKTTVVSEPETTVTTFQTTVEKSTGNYNGTSIKVPLKKSATL